MGTKARRPSTNVSLRYYGVSRDSLSSHMSFPNPAFISNDAGFSESSRTESPVYGLDGIVRQKRNSTVSLARTSVSSFEELIQQQAELDRSIAALRLFSPPPMEEAVAEGSSPREEPRRPSLRTANSSNHRTVSTVTTSSARSEFSLSIFPDPPVIEIDAPLQTSFAAMRATRARLLRRDVPSSFDLNGSVDLPPIPFGLARSAFSNATLYDVTSFIGEVAGSPSSRPLTAAPELGQATEIESAQDGLVTPAVQTSTGQSTTEEDATIVPPARKNSYPPLRPFFLGNVTSAPTVSSPLTGGARGPFENPGLRRTVLRGLPSQPKLAISGPRPSSINRNQAPGAFESPRRPPLFPSGVS